MKRLENKIIVVTGAGSGIGKATADALAKENARLTLTDINFENVEKVAQQINEAGGEAIAIKHNVADEEEWKKVIAETEAHYGPIAGLINNAGILGMEPVATETFESFERILNINTNSVFYGMKYVIPSMQKNQGGSIVNLSSLSALYGVGGAGYNASKGAVRAMTKNTALVYGKDRIRVNSVHPGAVMTPLIGGEGMPEQQKEAILSQQVLPDIIRPEDVANLIVFLASDESKQITGAEMLIDAGTLVK